MSNRPSTRVRQGTPTRRPGQQAPASSASRTKVMIGLGIALVVAAVIAIAVSVGGDGDGDLGAQTRPVIVSGTALARHNSAVDRASDPAIGRAAPAVTGSSFDGTAVRLANDGTPKVLVFLAHWCPVCQREVPVISSWAAANGAPQGVAIYGVATGTTSTRPNYPPQAWLEREGWPFPVMADDADGSAANAFGLSGYPYFVAIDAGGNVVDRQSGAIGVAELEQLIARARAGT
jgi:cytochrome c biogenesis protein CcmG, thiol:disulfide interchange protein DsbE